MLEGWLGTEGRGTPTVTLAQECSAAPPSARPAPAAFHTFILSRVVDAEVPVPHDCQLHGQVVDLHPLVGILWAGQGGEKEESGVTEIPREAGCSSWGPHEHTGLTTDRDCACGGVGARGRGCTPVGGQGSGSWGRGGPGLLGGTLIWNAGPGSSFEQAIHPPSTDVPISWAFPRKSSWVPALGLGAKRQGGGSR